MRGVQKAIAADLKAEGHTQEQIAAKLGVAQGTVAKWLGPIIPGNNASTADNRVKVPKAEQAEIFERVEADELKTQIAADYGITERHISRVAKKEQNERDRAKVRKEAAELAIDTEVLEASRSQFIPRA